jgi:hypothetical protein
MVPGGAGANTCPPTLVNYGSGPGILCDEPVGTTCADSEQFCICGEMTIEGSPWNCVPTEAGCPSSYPRGQPCNDTTSSSCDYIWPGRETCTCRDGT